MNYVSPMASGWGQSPLLAWSLSASIGPKGKEEIARVGLLSDKLKSGLRRHRFLEAQDHPTQKQPKNEDEYRYRKGDDQKLHGLFEDPRHSNPNLLPAGNIVLLAAVSLPPFHGIRVADKVQNVFFRRPNRSGHNKFQTARIGDRKSGGYPAVPLQQAPCAACQQP